MVRNVIFAHHLDDAGIGDLAVDNSEMAGKREKWFDRQL